MNLEQIKSAVDRGAPVYYKDKINQVFHMSGIYQVRTNNGRTILFGLTNHGTGQLKGLTRDYFTDCKHDEHEACMVCTNCGHCREDLDSNDLCMDCGGIDENEPSAIEIAEKLSLFDEAIEALDGLVVALEAQYGDLVKEIKFTQIEAARTVIAKAKEISK
jgi:hypothetical protein